MSNDGNNSSFDAVFEPRIDIASTEVPNSPGVTDTGVVPGEAEQASSKEVRFEIIRDLNDLHVQVVWMAYRKNGELSPSTLLEDSLERAFVKAQR